MSRASIAPLADRGGVAVTGPEARAFLDNLVTNDLAALMKPGDAAHAALLSPQGKILFAFFVIQTAIGVLIDVPREQVGDLVKRLSMYKLRAKVEIADASDSFSAFATWGPGHVSSGETTATVSFADPRHTELGRRILAEARFATDISSGTNGTGVRESNYHAHRIALGVPEGGRDYPLGDTFPHEACLDLFNGVSFTKGCYVGQEVVARMQHKTVVRKRVARIHGTAVLSSGVEVRIGDAVIGTVGTVAGNDALALIRLDRAVEAEDKGQPLTAAGVDVRVHADDLARYRTAAANRPVAPDLPS